MFINTRRCALAAATGLLLAATQANAQERGGPAPGGWAVVDSDGTLGANGNVLRVKHTAVGVYRVEFNQDVSHCAANATLAARDGKTLIPGYVLIGHGRGKPQEVRIFTFLTATLLPADYRFNLMLAC